MLSDDPDDSEFDKLKEELAQLRVTFAKFLQEYKKEVQKSTEAQKNLIEFLKNLLGKELSDCSFLSYFNTLKEEEVSLFNITYLDESCKVFPDDIR